MRIWLNNEERILPSSLEEMTLGQRIDFQNQYGNQLDEKAKQIFQIKDELEKELELSQFQIERMFCTVAFFLNCTVESLKESNFVDEIANIYFACLSELFKEEEQFEPQTEFVWKKKEWFISSPELKNGDRMKFGEFIDSKQIVQNMIKLGKGKWECILPLAVIFLRKKDEEYEESFLFDDSERLKLMRDLPMSIAVQLAFFLSSSLNMLMKTSPYSFHLEQKELEKTSKVT